MKKRRVCPKIVDNCSQLSYEAASPTKLGHTQKRIDLQGRSFVSGKALSLLEWLAQELPAFYRERPDLAKPTPERVRLESEELGGPLTIRACRENRINRGQAFEVF